MGGSPSGLLRFRVTSWSYYHYQSPIIIRCAAHTVHLTQTCITVLSGLGLSNESTIYELIPTGVTTDGLCISSSGHLLNYLGSPIP